ncbi:MAG: hypothetical protein GY777_26440 [Candidatus Brocadiaceae bacterium]|nr:hypothetical protein [Candidatus Brocadiaceae bacterium]
MKLISGSVAKMSIAIIMMLFVFMICPSLTVDVQGAGTDTGYYSGSKEIPETVQVKIVIITSCLIICAFIGILFLGWWKDGNLDKGEMRRAIAGTFVIGFTILMILCLSFNIYQKEVIIAYIQLVGIVIGFYFGAKTAAEKKTEAAAKIDIENIRLPDPKKVAITIRNGGETAITVDKIYVNESAFDKVVKIGPQNSLEIELELPDALQPGYKIKIATTTGLTSEISK